MANNKSVRRYDEIEESIRETLNEEIQKLTQKYGVDQVRLTVNKYFSQIKEKERIQKQIQKKKEELKKLEEKTK